MKEWEDGVWPDRCTGCQIMLQFQGEGAHPWLLGRPNGLAQGISNRLVAGDRFSGKKIRCGVHFCMVALLSAVGFSARYPAYHVVFGLQLPYGLRFGRAFSAYRMVCGSNPADLYGWQDGGGDLLFVE